MTVVAPLTVSTEHCCGANPRWKRLRCHQFGPCVHAVFHRVTRSRLFAKLGARYGRQVPKAVNIQGDNRTLFFVLCWARSERCRAPSRERKMS